MRLIDANVKAGARLRLWQDDNGAWRGRLWTVNGIEQYTIQADGGTQDLVIRVLAAGSITHARQLGVLTAAQIREVLGG